MVKQTVVSRVALRNGFTWAAGDRYSQSACEVNPLAVRISTTFEREDFHHVPEEAKLMFRHKVLALFERIPVRVQFVPQEPYDSCEEMARDVYDRKVLRARQRRGGVGLLAGGIAQKWRAVHDYYGHVCEDAPFTMSGEFAAFSRHAVQFPRLCWPGIYSNVVMENVFRLNRGHFLCYPKVRQCPSKVVFDPVMFGPVADFYGDAGLYL